MSQATRLCYFIFDVLVYQNRDLTQLPLVERRAVLKSVLKFRSPRVRTAEYFGTSAHAMLESARKAQRLMGEASAQRWTRNW